MKPTNAKVLFSGLIKAIGVDCICDIGSCDGSQSLLFRDICPSVTVLAFEANPINYRAMQAREALRTAGIQIFGFAISNKQATATFHVSDVDYSDASQNVGTSSFYLREGLAVKETIQVETRRIDEFILERFPEKRRVAIWIDVEGAEYIALEGMEKVADRVVAVHVETAVVPMRSGQRTLSELQPLMARYGFKICGSNIRRDDSWGDVVFLNQAAADAIGWRLWLCRIKAKASYRLKADQSASYLKRRFPRLHRLLRRVYLRLAT
jgi:FkbM family methyltransferase